MLTAEQVKRLADRQEQGEDVLEDEQAFGALFEYFMTQMPYGTAKARTGDPFVWIGNKLTEIARSL